MISSWLRLPSPRAPAKSLGPEYRRPNVSGVNATVHWRSVVGGVDAVARGLLVIGGVDLGVNRPGPFTAVACNVCVDAPWVLYGKR
eukprot:5163247-Lingulodinium_polyedra.AAC.1